MTRDDPPTEVYATDADYVRLDMKRLTAKRLVGWLKDAADVFEIGGASKSAEHARAVANRLEHELERDSDE